MLSSKPTSRSPTAVASGSTRLTAPPTAQPPICEKGEVIDFDARHDRVDDLVGELRQPVRLPVVVPPVRRAAVEHRLEGDVRHRAHQLGDRRADCAQRRDRLLARGRVAGPDEHERQDRLAILLRRQERHGGAMIAAKVMPSSSGASGAKSRRKRRTSGASASGQKIGPPSTSGPTGWSWYSKRGGDPEVAAAAAQPPEELRLGLGVDVHPLAVGGHQVDGEQVVHGQAVLAHEVPEPAAERQPADAGVADDAARGGEPERLGGAVELAPEEPAGRPRGARRRIDPDRLHQREVDHQPAVADGVTGDGVPAAAHRDEQVALPREADGRRRRRPRRRSGR